MGLINLISKIVDWRVARIEEKIEKLGQEKAARHKEVAPVKLPDIIYKDHEIKCEYCGNTYDYRIDNCPTCGAKTIRFCEYMEDDTVRKVGSEYCTGTTLYSLDAIKFVPLRTLTVRQD